MIVFEAGASLGCRSLGGILRERWTDLAKSIAWRNEVRKRTSAPNQEPTEYEAELPEYGGDPGLDDVFVTFHALPRSSFDGYVQRWNDTLKSEDAAALQRAVAHDFLDTTKAKVEGLKRANGDDFEAEHPFSTGVIQILEDNKLLGDLFHAGIFLHGLTGERRKNCGASQQSTSTPSTATPALLPEESSGDAMEALATGIASLRARDDKESTSSTGAPSA